MDTELCTVGFELQTLQYRGSSMQEVLITVEGMLYFKSPLIGPRSPHQDWVHAFTGVVHVQHTHGALRSMLVSSMTSPALCPWIQMFLEKLETKERIAALVEEVHSSIQTLQGR